MFDKYIYDELKKGTDPQKLADLIADSLNAQIQKVDDEKKAQEAEAKLAADKLSDAEKLAAHMNAFAEVYYPTEFVKDIFTAEDIVNIFNTYGKMAAATDEAIEDIKAVGKVITKELKDGKWETKVQEFKGQDVINQLLKPFGLDFSK